MLSPTDSNYILADTPGGLFKTTDGGATWTMLTDGTPIIGGVIGISSITVNPLDSNTIFLGTSMIDETGAVDGALVTAWGYGAGILESFDGGNTWQADTNFD